MKMLMLLSLFLLTACGESPLFNHKMEKAFLNRDQIFVENNGTSFNKIDRSFSLDWKVGPELGESRFVLKTWNNSDATFNGPYTDLPYQLQVVLWMPAMGHGSAPTKITKINAGEYDVSSVYFIMNGKWDLKVQLLKDGKVFDEVLLSLTL